jgi:hypothetical protein
MLAAGVGRFRVANRGSRVRAPSCPRAGRTPNVLVANFATPSPKFRSGARFALSVPTEVAIDSAKPFGVDLVAVPTEVVEPVKRTVRRLPQACRRHRGGDDVRKTRSRKHDDTFLGVRFLPAK